MEHCLLDYPAIAQVLDDDALEQPWRHAGIPDTFRIDHDNRPTGADAKTRRLAAFYALGSKEQAFPMKEPSKLRIQGTTAPFRGAEAAHAHEHMARVRFHECGWRVLWSHIDLSWSYRPLVVSQSDSLTRASGFAAALV